MALSQELQNDFTKFLEQLSETEAGNITQEQANGLLQKVDGLLDVPAEMLAEAQDFVGTAMKNHLPEDTLNAIKGYQETISGNAEQSWAWLDENVFKPTKDAVTNSEVSWWGLGGAAVAGVTGIAIVDTVFGWFSPEESRGFVGSAIELALKATAGLAAGYLAYSLIEGDSDTAQNVPNAKQAAPGNAVAQS